LGTTLCKVGVCACAFSSRLCKANSANRRVNNFLNQSLIVNNTGIVYERDLGPSTGCLAHLTTSFNPGKTWKPIEGE
jgi:hypothetical protein